MDQEKGRWGIWIDVEGFGNLSSAGDLALRGLGQLTSLIFEIGRQCDPRDGERLFAHQMGDAFYIASDFHEESLDRCAALAIVLMRGMTELDASPVPRSQKATWPTIGLPAARGAG